MSISTITAAQRVELRDATLSAALAMQRFAQSGTPPRTDETTEVTPVLEAAAAALVMAGASGLPSTSTVITNAQPVTVTDSSGNPSVNGTANVAAGALTNVALSSATQAIVSNAQALDVFNSSGTAKLDVPSPMVVVGGDVTQLRLLANAAIVRRSVKHPVGTVTGSGTFGTFTVVNNVITGIVLSAS